jgi:choline monooxygenase
VAFSDRVQQEDVDICEHVQRGLASRAYDRGRFSVEAEAGVYHFQCLLKESYRVALDQEDTSRATA